MDDCGIEPVESWDWKYWLVLAPIGAVVSFIVMLLTQRKINRDVDKAVVREEQRYTDTPPELGETAEQYQARLNHTPRDRHA